MVVFLDFLYVWQHLGKTRNIRKNKKKSKKLYFKSTKNTQPKKRQNSRLKKESLTKKRQKNTIVAILL